MQPCLLWVESYFGPAFHSQNQQQKGPPFSMRGVNLFRVVSYPAARTRAHEASFGRFRGRCLGRQPKTGVVLRRLLNFAAITTKSGSCSMAL
jgi:hypothetical protein